MKASQINTFLFFKLPAAWFTGVRLKSISSSTAVVSVKHGWRNQNPFKSMFWAVQGMAAELSTGAMVMSQINTSGKKISMLVLNNKANFSKKARGRIYFTCTDGELVATAIKKTLESGEPQTCWMQSVGKNKAGETVSTFDFEWTLKAK